VQYSLGIVPKFLSLRDIKVFHLYPGVDAESGDRRGKHWNFVFVKVYTDAGIDGVGEGFASGRFRIGALGVLGVGLAAETDA